MAVKTRTQIQADADTYLPNNNAQIIKPKNVRDRIKDMADSVVFPEDAPTGTQLATVRKITTLRL